MAHQVAPDTYCFNYPFMSHDLDRTIKTCFLPESVLGVVAMSGCVPSNGVTSRLHKRRDDYSGDDCNSSPFILTINRALLFGFPYWIPCVPQNNGALDEVRNL